MSQIESPKVWIVDDDLSTRSSLDSMFRSVGYAVEMFETGLEFLHQAHSAMAGCIIIDVRLPGPSGLEIHRRLYENNVRMPVIFMTGHGDIDMAVRAMKAGAFEFLTKPFKDQVLLDTVSNAFECDQAQRERALIKDQNNQALAGLTAREREIFQMLCEGQLGKQVAYSLNLSEATIKVHRRNILHKLNVSTVSQMVQRYYADISPLMKTPSK